MLEIFRDRLLAADPGFTRLLLASRVTLAVAFTVVGLAIAAVAYDVPVTVTILGAIVAMQALLAINDDKPHATTALAALPGIVGIVLGAIFASRGIWADLVFLAVLFGAVAVRLRGPRWTAFGTIAMMTYFFALFLGATPAQLPALIGAVLVAIGFTYAVRFLLLPERPAWIARRTIDAFEARIRFVAIASKELLETRDAPAARRRLRTTLARLNETAASIEGRLRAGATDALRIVFDAELAAEDLAAEAQALRDAAVTPSRALRIALKALAAGRGARAARVAERVVHAAAPDHPAARAVAGAIVDVSDALTRLDSTVTELALSEGPWGGGAGAQQPVMRQAVQVTLASAVAIAVGEALSPSRWYWAVLATYFVFLGTASSGETFARAWSRIGGTALGVGAGIIVGHLAQGHPWLDLGAIFGCLFLGVYFLRISYLLMIFFITALLALLYTVLGRFSDGLLGIRLVETAIGAICGGVAATVILPTRTRDVVRAGAAGALEAAQAVVDASIARLTTPDVASPLEAARDLEARVALFIARAKPAVSAPALIGRGHELRRWIVSLSACSYYARLLARTADRTQTSVDPALCAQLDQIGRAMATNIAAANGRIDGRHDAHTQNTLELFGALRSQAQTAQAHDPALLSALYLLERLDRAIARLARDEGTVVEVA